LNGGVSQVQVDGRKISERKILLIRHGKTDWNDVRRFQGRTDVPLNEEGLSQARKVADRVSSWPVDAVYSSPLQRALRTAEAVASRHGKEPVVVEDLTEMNFGPWEGAGIRTLRERDPGFMREWLKDPFFHMPAGSETWDEVRGRVGRAIRMVLDSAHKHVVIVSHGGITRVLLALLLNLDPHTVWNLRSSNCAISGIELREHQNLLAFSNDDLHLRDIPEGVSLPVW